MRTSRCFLYVLCLHVTTDLGVWSEETSVFVPFETCFGNLLVSRTSIHKWRTLGMVHMLFPTFQKHDSKLVLSRNAKQNTFQYFTSWLLPLILSRFVHPGYKWIHPTYPTSKSRDITYLGFMGWAAKYRNVQWMEDVCNKLMYILICQIIQWMYIQQIFNIYI